MRPLQRPDPGLHLPEAAVSRYRKRLSGPLLDRIDLQVDVPRVEYDKLASDGLAEAIQYQRRAER